MTLNFNYNLVFKNKRETIYFNKIEPISSSFVTLFFIYIFIILMLLLLLNFSFFGTYSFQQLSKQKRALGLVVGAGVGKSGSLWFSKITIMF